MEFELTTLHWSLLICTESVGNMTLIGVGGGPDGNEGGASNNVGGGGGGGGAGASNKEDAIMWANLIRGFRFLLARSLFDL